MFNPMQIPQITPEQAKEKLKNKNGFIIVDVRENNEVQYVSLAKINLPFIHIKMGEVPQRLAELPKDKEIGILCHHGNRSGRITAFLRQKGYNAVNIQGGIDYWSKTIDPSLPKY